MAEAIGNRTITLSSGFDRLPEFERIAVDAIRGFGGDPALAGPPTPTPNAFDNVRATLDRSEALILLVSPQRLSTDPFALAVIEFELDEADRRRLPILAFIARDVEYANFRERGPFHAFEQKLLGRLVVHYVDDTKHFQFVIRTALAELMARLRAGRNDPRPEGLFLDGGPESMQPAETIDEIDRAEKPSPPKSPEAPPPTPALVPENLQTAPFYSDHAARSDLLNRKAVAETVATMIENVWRDTGKDQDIDRTFMVHLHGRWGSGKTSILNFLKDSLLSQNSSGSANKAADPSWLVIDYNAWRNQALGPAWWTLMETVYRQASQQLGGWRTESGQRLILRDGLWRLRSSYAPYALVAGLLIAFVLLLIFVWRDSFVATGKPWIDEAMKFVVSLVGLFAAVFAFGHSYSIGSARTAKSYLELSRDPLNPLIQRYGDLVEDAGRPVAVFIDDLDRCNAQFVVELLQTIQTLFRNAKVLYVVAADRDWVCASYQQIYKSFNETIGEPGKSLGHLFVEKVFQLSVEVPRLNEVERNRFWEELIKSNLPLEPMVEQELVEEATREIERAKTESQIIEVVDRYRNDPGVAQIVAAKAFRQMQAAPVEKERQHFLNKYAGLIEPNPRAMKRLLNAYGFRRGFDIQSRHRSDPDALVRWTILENRWPILADYLEGRIAGNAIIEALVKDKAVLDVANGLTWEKLRPVASAPDEPPKPETTPGTAKK
jgi:hypothetical protein